MKVDYDVSSLCYAIFFQKVIKAHDKSDNESDHICTSTLQSVSKRVNVYYIA